MNKGSTANYLAPGHNACPGCGVSIAVRHILRATGSDVIIVSPTGCLETFTSPYNSSAWEVPWVHSLFENAPAVASGIEAALKARGNESTHVVVIGGDGATFDIGMGALSGMLERNHDILYICYDNEAYMNTGIQRSGGTPLGASTMTTPAGEKSPGETLPKKDMLALALAHNVNYVASATIAYPRDLMSKVKKGLAVKGAAYIHVLIPCTLGWGYEAEQTIALSRLAFESGIFPLLEYEDGELTGVRRITKPKPVDDYLNAQRRFAHLKDEAFRPVREQISAIAARNIQRYGLTDSA